MKPNGLPVNGYRTVDLMRFLAAATVVWNHTWNMFVPPLSPAFGGWHFAYQTAGFGPDAVRVFFVISGYWITASVLRKSETGGWTWGGYLIDRLSRLGVVLIPVLAVGFVLDGTARYLFGFWRYADFTFIDLAHVDLGERLSTTNLFGNLAFLQNIYVRPFGSNLPLWSLANEFWYYIWFPALFLLFRLKASVMTGLTLVTIVMFVETNVTQGFPIWLMGSAVYVATQRIGERYHRLSAKARVGAGLAMLALFLTVLLATHLFPTTWLLDGMIEGAAFSLLLSAVLVFNVDIPKLLHPLARYGAEASFSLYLVHFPVLLFGWSVVSGGALQAPSFGVLAMALGMLIFLITMAWGFAQLTEKHTGLMRRRLSALLLRPKAARET